MTLEKKYLLNLRSMTDVFEICLTMTSTCELCISVEVEM